MVYFFDGLPGGPMKPIITITVFTSAFITFFGFGVVLFLNLGNTSEVKIEIGYSLYFFLNLILIFYLLKKGI